MNSRILSGALIVLCCLFSAAVSADIPRGLEDLVGEKASKGDPKMQRRGYVHIETQRGGSHNSWGMWWNPTHKECATVAYEHGRIKSIVSSPPIDCNQNSYHTSYGNNDRDDDSNAGAALAVGAAALIGALVVSHKSHHHDEDQHYTDQVNEGDFERGYRDGLYNKSYDNFNSSGAYRQGYQSGVDQREHDASYRYHNGSNKHAYRQQAKFTDLNGARGAGADSALRERGFRDVDGFKEGSAAYTIWYNGSTSQCLQMMVSNGRVEDIRDIGQHPGCR
jgi:hypothetical protein